MEIQLNLYLTGCIAVLLLVLGRFMVERIAFLRTYCIPAPVVGGLVFAIVHLALHSANIVTFTFDETLKNVFMMLFFTSVGFTACFRLLRQGGFKVILFLAISVIMCVLQNVLAGTLGSVLLDQPLLGLATGSIPMVGGHGTAGSFGPVLAEKYGVVGADTVAIAAATFGLVAGGMLGGPVARARIKQYDLEPTGTFDSTPAAKIAEEETTSAALNPTNFLNAIILLLVAAGLGTIVTSLLGNVLTVPNYIGAMVIGAIIRNVADAMGKEIPSEAIDTWGNTSLSIFLAIALMTLKLWQLAALAVPMIIMLLAQTVLMFFIAYFVVFRLMGADYEAAVMSSAFCGFGMGATPNAMANMQAVTKIYGPAPQAFFIVPLVGSLFIDFFNAAIITFFMNFLA